MLSAIALGIAQNVVLGWVWRRAQELVAWAFTLVPLYLSLPAAHQETIRDILTGHGGGLSISAVLGLAWYLWTQWQSFGATVKPQVVTSDGKKIPVEKNTRASSQIEAVATAAPKPRTLWDRLTGG